MTCVFFPPRLPSAVLPAEHRSGFERVSPVPRPRGDRRSLEVQTPRVGNTAEPVPGLHGNGGEDHADTAGGTHQRA